METIDAPQRAAAVDLYWIPLGAGHHSIRLNGIVYEAIVAKAERRARCDLYHSVIELRLSHGDYWVEMTPIPDGDGQRRGVVGHGPVGVRALAWARPFRYEIRRWRDGIVPDLDYAVESPIRVASDELVVQRVFDLLPEVPKHVWGRDALGVGDMWSCNSIVSWVLATAGIDVTSIPFPAHARAPGWEAGQVAAAVTSPPSIWSSH